METSLYKNCFPCPKYCSFSYAAQKHLVYAQKLAQAVQMNFANGNVRVTLNLLLLATHEHWLTQDQYLGLFLIINPVIASFFVTLCYSRH